MKKSIVNTIKCQFAIIVAGVLLLAILCTGLPYTLTHATIFSPVKAHAASQNPIQVENSQPGTPGWNDFSADAASDTLSGFGSKISANHGDTIDFYVTTTAPSFTIDIYRTGFYNGDGARLITSLGSFPGLHQAIPAPDKVTGMISCTSWSKTTSLTIPSAWVTGVYLAKLTSSTGKSSFILFIVRNDGGSEDLLFQTSVTTYQAYNTWGGTSLYNNNLTDKTLYAYPHATKVSFDRPFNPGDSNGAGQYFFFEYKFVYWMEQQGYNVAYTTSVDTDARPGELLKRKAFLSGGHDEYWSMGMHNAVQSAISAGVNVAFFSANTMYWQVRFESNTAGVANRVEVGYKDFAESSTPPGPDPMWNVNNSIVTTNWRDPVVNMPENGTLGVMYEQQEDNDYAYVVTNASNWIYAGTGFVDGSSVPGIVGYEYDRVFNNGFTPPNVTVLSNSPVHGCCGGYSSFSNSTIYTAPSGARVFASGTIQWSLGLANIQSNTYQDARIQKTTANILNNFINSTSAPTSGVSTSSPNLRFGNQAVNTTSSAQTVKITNTSTAALTFSNIAVTGTNASDFAQTNTCPSSLAANTSCTVNVTFKPTTSGARSGNLSLTDSSIESPQVVVLSGTAIASGSAANLSASTLSFGNQTIKTTSVAQNVTVTNTGSATLTFSNIQIQGINASDFAQTNTCGSSLAVGASCTISVTFTPSASSTRAGNLTLLDNASDSPQQVVLSGSGVSSGSGVTLNPTSLTFGSQTQGTTSAAQAVTFTNSTSNALTFSSIAVSGTNASDFAQTNTCPVGSGSLAVNASCTINVTFTPGASGARNGSITLTDSSTDSPQTIPLSGTGVAPVSGVTVNPQSLSFGNQTLGTTSSAKTVTLTNNNSTALAISSIAVTGTNAGDFAQTNTCGSSLTANASCTISVTFTPSGSSALSASVTITDNDVGSPQTVALSGTGVPKAPAVSLNPTSLSFGNQNVSTSSSAQTITVTNSGTDVLSISSIALSGTNASDFAQTNTCPVGSGSLAVNASCTISVIFTPGAGGARSGSVTLTDNAAGSPQAVGLSGTGVVPATVYFSDGFESGGFSQWTNGASGTGTATVQTSVVNTGTEAAQLTNAASQTVQLSTALSNMPALTYTRFYFRFASLSATTLIALGQDGGGHNQWIMYYDSGRQGLDIYFWNGVGQRYDIYSNANVVSANTWYAIEVETNQATSGHGEVWLNGNSIGAFNGDLSQTQSYGKLILDNEATGTAYFDDVAVANGFTIPLTPSVVKLAPKSLSFGNQIVNTTSSGQTVTMTNVGTTALSINSIAVTGTNAGDFVQSNTCGSSLAANASCTISVTFTPGASGARSGNVTITDSDVSSPQIIPLSGNGSAKVPAVSLNPTSLSFGNQSVSTSSSAQTITVTNSGTDVLSISSIALSGTNASDFAQTNTCPVGSGSLAVNASCTISVIFTPGAGGARSGSVTLTDNAAGSPQAVGLSGTGVVPATVYFSDGFETGDFSQWTNGASGTGTATVQTSVVNTGTEAAQLTNAASQTVQLSTALSNMPALTYTRFYFRFASLSAMTLIALGQDGGGHNQWIMYYDSGRQGLDIYFWNGAGQRYDIYSNTNVLSANTWYAIEVETNQATSGHGEVWLNGNSIGAFNGDLSQTQSYGKLILDNEATGTAYFDDVAVANGFTIPTTSSSVKLAPKSLSFGNQIVNTTSSVQTVTMTNVGTTALSINSIAVTGTNAGDFAQTNTCPSSLAVNTSCTVNITFRPTVSGTRSGSLTFTDSSIDSPQMISLSGNGSAKAPAVSLNPTSLSFGNQNVSTSSNAKTITVTNSGTDVLTISSIALSGTNASDFTQTNTCPVGSGSLAVNASCTINVIFTPGASGARSGSVTLTDNAAGSPQAVGLSGTGVVPAPPPTAYFSDGFESGSFSKWTNGASGTGTATVQNSVVHGGTYAAQLTNAASQTVQVSTALSNVPSLTYTRFYFRFTSLSGLTLIALGQDGGGHNQWIMYYDSGRQGLDIYFWNGAGQRYDVYSNTNVLSANTWYAIEVETNQATSGHGEVWLNGTSIGAFNGDLSQTQSYGKLILDNEVTGTAYFDDVVVSNSYNGP